MEAECELSGGGRKRTESNGTSSDSELSDGWNLVDHVDVPSSDGESVEVIETETSGDVLAGEGVGDGDGQLLVRPETEVMSADQPQLPVVADDAPTVREEMFDSSFCWFLFFAVSAVCASNLALLAADYVMDSNFNVKSYENVPPPSFLRDLPVTPKQIPQSNSKLPNTAPWTSSEEVVVETVEEADHYDHSDTRDVPGKSIDTNKSHKSNADAQKTSLKIFNHEIQKYFNDLSRVTGSAEAQNKFAQTLLILDAIHVGLNDLEEVVPESSELRQVLESQRTKLTEALSEIEFGVARSMEKIASIVLNKVQKLERSFENQWCRLEKKGYKEVLKGLFYDCYETEEKYHNKDQKTEFQKKDGRGKKSVDSDEINVETSGESNLEPKFTEENIKDDHKTDKNKNVHTNSFKYDRRKPIISVVESKYHGSEKQVKFVNYGKERNEKSIKRENVINHEQSNKHKHEGKKDKFPENGNIMNPPNDNSFWKENAEKGSLSQKNYKHFKQGDSAYKSNKENYEKHGEMFKDKKDSKSYNHGRPNEYEKSNKQNNKMEKNYNKNVDGENQNVFKGPDNNRFFTSKNMEDNSETNENGHYKKKEQNNFIKSAADKLSNYLKEKCENQGKITSELYKKLKDSVKDKIKVPIEMFNNMFNKFCSPSKDNSKENKYKKEYFKSNNGGKHFENKDFTKAKSTTIESQNIKNVMEFKILEPTEESVVPLSTNREKVIEATNTPRQWTFVYEGSKENETSVDGEWFIKAGESRSKARWSQQRGDWWFDRATHRRSGSHPSPRNWFAGQRKNWFFRRAWARQQCRQNPYDEWCHLPTDTTA